MYEQIEILAVFVPFTILVGIGLICVMAFERDNNEK